MTSCVQCGSTTTPIRVDGHCFRCHIRSIRWAFAGASRTRASFHDETIGEVQRETERNPDAERIGQRWV